MGGGWGETQLFGVRSFPPPPNHSTIWNSGNYLTPIMVFDIHRASLGGGTFQFCCPLIFPRVWGLCGCRGSGQQSLWEWADQDPGALPLTGKEAARLYGSVCWHGNLPRAGTREHRRPWYAVSGDTLDSQFQWLGWVSSKELQNSSDHSGMTRTICIFIYSHTSQHSELS